MSVGDVLRSWMMIYATMLEKWINPQRMTILTLGKGSGHLYFGLCMNEEMKRIQRMKDKGIGLWSMNPQIR